MYASYYQLTAMPFQLTPDRQFFFDSREHSRAMAHLAYGLAQEEGFVVITGEIGAGKTMLVERLWGQLDERRYGAVRLLTTQLGGEDLLRMVTAGFGLPTSARDKADLLQELERHFADQQRLGRRCLLVVDEAQNLPLTALEELRMLSNMTIGGRAPFQGVLLGQPQFRRMLAGVELEQLRQRVLASYHLGPLSTGETRTYIEHRLKTAGWAGNPSFEDGAFAAIHRHTEGIPRRINTLCSRLLLFGALEETHSITETIANEVANELRQDLAGPKSVAVMPRPARNGNGNGEAAHPALETRLDRVEAKLKRHDRIIKSAVEIGVQLLEARR
ncbi:MAG TPA: XrtA/PEP-CTERM system-associated ATPase [Stellaceae bacterium]|nr:XrtA/PEP-CTERM system-associated ATPase [Stellaceae bacterium]